MADQDAKTYALIGAILPIIGFVIVSLTKTGGDYAMFYAKQGLALGIAWIAVWIAGWILAFVPIIGWIITLLLYVGLLIFWVLGIVNSQSGEKKAMPIIGDLAKRF